MSHDTLEQNEPETRRLLDALGTSPHWRATDDVLALTLPLFEQVRETHERGKVAPFEGVEEVMLTAGKLWFEQAKARTPRSALSEIARLQKQRGQAFQIDDRYHRVDDDDGSSTRHLGIVEPGEKLERPAFVTRYVCWEHEVGHHDPLTDVYSLGLILASVAADRNLGEADALEDFVRARADISSLGQRLHPVVARVIARMTEPDRRKRVQDLGQVMATLRNYREQTAQPDEPLTTKTAGDALSARRTTYGKLRDRLVDFSRKNRLLHFQATGQTVNLTHGSVPLVMDVESVPVDSLLTWQGRSAKDVASTKPVPLGRYLRFEDYPFLSSALDQLRLDANRSKTELGFSPLRLVVCFLHWHNLKEQKEARIVSPLLLLPVALDKKKGVRDAVFLTAESERAEVNPVLRQYLQLLYGVELPEHVDISEPSAVETLSGDLLRQLHQTEPGISLTLVDKPRVDMILAQAKRRLDAYRKRVALSGRAARSHRGFDYSYARGKLHPLGVQMFAHLVYPSPAPNRELHDEPRPRIFQHSPEVVEKSLYALKDGFAGGPYEWALDTCSVTLANFNYRKMSLARDYAGLIESSTPHAPFQALFSDEARPVLADPEPTPIEERFEVMPADPTQSSAVARARRGESFIIQGPPGTGKSQTITNLIADYVGRGKRVLFVCEKRAAIDVVYHRLRMQGLAPLACLIHDSQADKKAFIKDLKETYEGFIAQPQSQAKNDARRRAAAEYGSILGRATRFRRAMQACPPSSEASIVALLGRALDLEDLPPSGVATEQLPQHRQFLASAPLLRNLEQALRAVGRDSRIAQHPLRLLADEVLFSENPSVAVRQESRAVLSLLDGLTDSQLARAAQLGSVAELLARIGFVQQLEPLIQQNALALLDAGSGARRAFDSVLQAVDERREHLAKATAAASGWIAPVPPADVKTALTLARRFEGSLLSRLFALFSPSYWRLRRLLAASFDFTSRAIRPTWSDILEKLASKQDAEEALSEARMRGEKDLKLGDLEKVNRAIAELPEETAELAPFRHWLQTPGAQAEAKALSRSAESARELPLRLARLLRDVNANTPQELRSQLATLEPALQDLPALLEPLRQLAAPEHRPLANLLRAYALGTDQLERDVCRAEADSALRERALDVLSGVDWDGLREDAMRAGVELRKENAAAIVERARNAFLAHVQLSLAAGDTLSREQKAEKRQYATGRKELEHEFGKVTRYRSIRDLATGAPGVVVRDLKPVWLMSPLSVADTLPLEAMFDVVIFDEASQIPLEDAVPAAYRGAQTIVVGDQMQLPPTDFFGSSNKPELDDTEREEDNGYELDAHSLLSHAERNLPSTMLGWHYRSRDESLIAFSNRVFYEGKLLTVPSVARVRPMPPIVASSPADGELGADALLERPISFHRVEGAPYEQRRNEGEARYIAQLLRKLLTKNGGKTIGIVAFSEAQQDEIEGALRDLAAEDPAFGASYEAELEREEDGQHVGLFIKNLENVQGDERDIVIISVCYGPDRNGRMLMNFGPINKTGGEKRLNVIFSRAKHHLAVVSSIRWPAITNDYNDGASCLRNYLRYAEAMSSGSVEEAQAALQSYRSGTITGAPRGSGSLDERLARGLRARGYEVELGIGTSQFLCNLGVRRPGEPRYQLGILLDDPSHQARPVDELLQAQPAVLRAFGWRTVTVLHKDWYGDPELVLKRIDAAFSVSSG